MMPACNTISENWGKKGQEFESLLSYLRPVLNNHNRKCLLVVFCFEGENTPDVQTVAEVQVSFFPRSLTLPPNSLFICTPIPKCHGADEGPDHLETLLLSPEKSSRGEGFLWLSCLARGCFDFIFPCPSPALLNSSETCCSPSFLQCQYG